MRVAGLFLSAMSTISANVNVRPGVNAGFAALSVGPASTTFGGGRHFSFGAAGAGAAP
jgi:hypothetical protein